MLAYALSRFAHRRRHDCPSAHAFRAPFAFHFTRTIRRDILKRCISPDIMRCRASFFSLPSCRRCHYFDFLLILQRIFTCHFSDATSLFSSSRLPSFMPLFRLTPPIVISSPFQVIYFIFFRYYFRFSFSCCRCHYYYDSHSPGFRYFIFSRFAHYASITPLTFH